MTRVHISTELLRRFILREATGAERAAVGEHITHCRECMMRADDLVELEAERRARRGIPAEVEASLAEFDPLGPVRKLTSSTCQEPAIASPAGGDGPAPGPACEEPERHQGLQVAVVVFMVTGVSLLERVKSVLGELPRTDLLPLDLPLVSTGPSDCQRWVVPVLDEVGGSFQTPVICAEPDGAVFVCPDGDDDGGRLHFWRPGSKPPKLDSLVQISVESDPLSPLRLGEILARTVDWERCPQVGSLALLQEMWKIVVEQRRLGRWVTTADRMYRHLLSALGPAADSTELGREFWACLRMLERTSQIVELSQHGWLLLQPDVLPQYMRGLRGERGQALPDTGRIPNEKVETAVIERTRQIMDRQWALEKLAAAQCTQVAPWVVEGSSPRTRNEVAASIRQILVNLWDDCAHLEEGGQYLPELFRGAPWLQTGLELPGPRRPWVMVLTETPVTQPDADYPTVTQWREDRERTKCAAYFERALLAFRPGGGGVWKLLQASGNMASVVPVIPWHRKERGTWEPGTLELLRQAGEPYLRELLLAAQPSVILCASPLARRTVHALFKVTEPKVTREPLPACRLELREASSHDLPAYRPHVIEAPDLRSLHWRSPQVRAGLQEMIAEAAAD